ncbi:carbohydrate-binding domain-containing protein [Lachnospiraceae bacterium OttesenSCG-928-J05]|nr:carbohydrate-binding domain-containing protein [Lachnospiraceae bacterium OttesenSCG-928-J05]
MKKLGVLILLVGLLLVTNGCGKEEESTEVTEEVTVEEVDSSEVTIECAGDTATASADSVNIQTSLIEITEAGTYRLSGDFSGQLRVNAMNTDIVTLILDNITITGTTSSAIYGMQAEEVIIELAAGSENMLSDPAAYTELDAEGEPDGCLYVQDDLTIKGEGALTVNGSYNDGVVSKDDLAIEGGVFKITATNHALKGRDRVAISDGDFTLVAGGEGIKSNNDTDAEKGVIEISGGTYQIEATGKGILAQTSLIISGGEYTLNTTDDALHTNGDLTVNGGKLTIASGDDGLHGDGNVVVAAGEITITKSYEGIEGTTIAINGGTLNITADDDGFNAASPSSEVSDGTPGTMRGPAEDPMGAADEACSLVISGGNVTVNAGGDGLDSNGSLTIAGGEILVYGPENDGNGTIDADGTYSITGGNLMAMGSSGMHQNPSSVSGVLGFTIYFNSTCSAGSSITLKNQIGEEVVTAQTLKDIRALTITNAGLVAGETYTLYVDGTERGSWILSEEFKSYTDSGEETSGGMGGMPGGGMNPGGMGGPGW